MPLYSQLPAHLDLTNPIHQQQIRRAADQLLFSDQDLQQLISLELEFGKNREQYPFAAHLAIKLAHSKRALQELKKPLHISVVFAIYKEHNRILSHIEHEHGENFLREKIKQLRWLCLDIPDISWDMIVVDDGCPKASGSIAERILAQEAEAQSVRVMFLQEAINQKHPITHPISSTNDSRKGGAITLGLWEAVQQSKPNHIVMFTDADLSTDIGQSGLLVAGILNQGADAAIGSRREPLSIVIKGGHRNNRGKLFIYLWKRLLPSLANIIDTQCGFKAFRAEVAKKILTGLTEKKFAFDIELLIKVEQNRTNSIEKIPIAWFDSEAASTTADLQPYLPMLKSIAGFYRTYLPLQNQAEGFAKFIEDLNEETWNRLLDNIPLEIAKREPVEFINYDGVSVMMLAKAAGIAI